MSGLISNLATSSKALSVQSKGLEIAGKNLANINNRNYAKQRVEIGDRGSINTGIATESMGVEAMELRQNRDALLDKTVMREYTASSGLEAAKKVLESAESALGISGKAFPLNQMTLEKSSFLLQKLKFLPKKSTLRIKI
ncbi:MAG: hypothetical protein NTZ94_15295 [Verrucomicrobia bacterium]|nr:hypothetical protein [Verrucomicrobiota bacterium]